MIRLTRAKIVPKDLLKSVESARYGGVVLFLGEIRNHSHSNKKVTSLEYCAYEEMALKKMRHIETTLLKKWKNKGIGKVSIVHRLGRLKVGEIAVGIAASAEHRKEAFLACHAAIDTLKRTVPIFKKEIYLKGKPNWVTC